MRSSLAMALALVCLPSRAYACGGFFCNATQPVVQSGEQIVYGVEDDGSLVMSVRIDYQGAAPEFAWILPVPVVPTISLGTTAVFDALERATEPRFTIGARRVDGTCMAPPACDYPPWRGADASVASSDVGTASDTSATTVYLDENLGPYETVVIGGASGGDVYAWLGAHGYTLAPSATPILDAYVARHDVFVALRLRTSASTAEIQPITLHMPGTPPCLPIRLTAIATQPDLPITAIFLARGRVVPSNYSVTDDPANVAALYIGMQSYTAWVTRSAAALGGHAFSTDFAGATPTIAIMLPSVSDLATQTDPAQLLRTLRGRGYVGDPQLFALLTHYLVPPTGMTARDYYNCLFLGATSTCGDPSAYDPAGLAAAIDQTITQPRTDAQALVRSRPYTTRLFTTMSAPDMTLDPEFRVDTSLPNVANVRSATAVTQCDPTLWDDEAARVLELPNGSTAPYLPAQPHGTIAAYCARHGGYPPGMGPDAFGYFNDAGRRYGDADGRIDGARSIDGGPALLAGGGGGCSCGVGTRATSWPLALGLLIAIARFRTRRG